MAEHRSVASWLPRSAGGALLLAGGGAGLWLLGSQSAPASADELSLPSAPGTLATQLLAPVGELAPPVVDEIVAPVVAHVVVPVVEGVAVPIVAEVALPVVEPVVDRAVEVVAPVAATAHVSEQDGPPIAVSTPADVGTPPVAEVEQRVATPDLAPVIGPRTTPATRVGAAPVSEPAA